MVFFISAGIYLTGCIIYGLFTTGELQPWAVSAGKPKTHQENNTEKSKKGIDNKAYQSNL